MTVACPIHLGVLNDPVTLPCQHSFCLTCISAFLKIRRHCPVCNQSIPDNYELKRNDLLTQLLQPKVITECDIQDQKHFLSTHSSDLVLGTFSGNRVIWKKYRQLPGLPPAQNKANNQYHLIKSLDFPDKLVRIYGVTKNPPGIVCEHLSASIQDLFNKRQKFSSEDVATIAKDVVQGLSLLHRNNFVHRDISAGNVLLDINHQRINRAKLADFDDVRASNTSVTISFLGTMAYMPPEVLLGHTDKPTPAGDIFSFGVLLWGLLSNQDPSSVREPLQALQMARFERKGAALIDISAIPEKFRPLIQSTTSINPINRPNATLLLNALISCFSGGTYEISAPPITVPHIQNHHFLAAESNDISNEEVVIETTSTNEDTEVTGSETAQVVKRCFYAIFPIFAFIFIFWFILSNTYDEPY
ncbi:hypothetical protein GEMRC1_001853 [Eukaryota sp. GEM-RC1]